MVFCTASCPARCVRPGQTAEVRVHSFVVAEGEEERVWHATRAGAE